MDLIRQPNLLEHEAPFKVCGDIHGQYFNLLRLFEYGGYPPQVNYLFMGNYVGYGKQGLETMCLLLAYKIKYPENFFLLRGNHEDAMTNRIYGFYDECKRRHNVRVWKMFNDCFNCLPVAALIDDKILCVHGGLSPDLHNLDEIRNLQRPTVVPNSGLLCDLLWSYPSRDIRGWRMNDSGVSYTFGPDKVSEFLVRHDLDIICRSNQVVEDGYEFFANRRLVTIFSAPYFRGLYDNAGAMMSVDESLLCSFEIWKPADKKFNFNVGATNSSKFPSGSRVGSMEMAQPGSTSNGSRTTVKPENTPTGVKGVVKRAPYACTGASKLSMPSSDSTTVGKPGNTLTDVNIGSGARTGERPGAMGTRNASPGGSRAVHFRVGEYVGQRAKAITRPVSPFNPERDGRRR